MGVNYCKQNNSVSTAAGKHDRNLFNIDQEVSELNEQISKKA